MLFRSVDERVGDGPGEVTQALGGKTGRYHINSFVWHWDADFRAWALESPKVASDKASESRHS